MIAFRDPRAASLRGRRARRLLVLATAAAAVYSSLAAVPAAQGSASPPPPERVDLYDMVTRDLGTLPGTGYRIPDETARADLRTGLDRVIARDWRGADEVLSPRDYAGNVQQDIGSGVYFGRVSPFEHPSEGWGSAYIMGAGTSVAIQVPHPGCAPGVERLGVEVARSVKESVLLVAGAKRYAGGPGTVGGCATPDPKPADCTAAADPSACADTVFHTWSEFLRGRSMPAVRLHALDMDLAVADVEVDAPEGAEPDFAESVAAAAERGGFTVCRSWVDVCLGTDEGMRSQQALAYGRADVPFAAVQVRQSVLDDTVAAALVAKSVAAGAAAWQSASGPPEPEPSPSATPPASSAVFLDEFAWGPALLGT